MENIQSELNEIFLANWLENNLNAIAKDMASDIEFLIFANEGDMVKTQKDHNNQRVIQTYTHGILKVQSNDLIPVKNLTYQTLNCQLMVFVDLLDSGFINTGNKKRKQSRTLANVNACLNTFVEQVNGNTYPLEVDGRHFTTTISMSVPTSGPKTSLGEITEGLPLYSTIVFTLFENGVNSSECSLRINGEDLYLTNLVISKVKVADQNEFATTQGGKSCVLVGGKSFDFVTPVVNTPACRMIMEEALGDLENRAIAVHYSSPLAEKIFIGIFGNITVNHEAGANMGFNVSVAEGAEDLLTYDDNWDINENYKGASIYEQNPCFIFWGDGTVDFFPNGGVNDFKHTYSDNKSVHVLRKYLIPQKE